jgi:hypothetical protein
MEKIVCVLNPSREYLRIRLMNLLAVGREHVGLIRAQSRSSLRVWWGLPYRVPGHTVVAPSRAGWKGGWKRVVVASRHSAPCLT